MDKEALLPGRAPFLPMRLNTNPWNRIRYTIYLPFYNIIGKLFSTSRRKSIGLLNISAGEKVLLIGAGTGLDIPYIPEPAVITAIDITPVMVDRIKKSGYQNVEALVMDGQQLYFPDASFDKIILHLILAVIPDPVKCIHEAERVLKPGGSIAVFDKFLDDNQQPSFFRRLLNFITTTLFSDINRRLGDLLSSTNLVQIHRQKADFGGNFIISILQKPQ